MSENIAVKSARPRAKQIETVERLHGLGKKALGENSLVCGAESSKVSPENPSCSMLDRLCSRPSIQCAQQLQRYASVEWPGQSVVNLKLSPEEASGVFLWLSTRL